MSNVIQFPAPYEYDDEELAAWEPEPAPQPLTVRVVMPDMPTPPAPQPSNLLGFIAGFVVVSLMLMLVMP